MQIVIDSINSSSRVDKKLDGKMVKVVRSVTDYDPLYTGFTTDTVDIAEPDLRSCDYKNTRRFQRISSSDGIPLCEWYEIKIKSQGGSH